MNVGGVGSVGGVWGVKLIVGVGRGSIGGDNYWK